MNFVFFPACHLGIDSSTSKLSLKVRPHVLRDYLVDVCEGLVRVGFKKFVCVSGNLGPAHLTAIEEAGKFLRTKHMRFGLFGRKSAPILVSANSIALLDDEKSNNPIWCDPKEHGGARDIEMALTLFPALVDPLWKGLPEIEKSPTGFPRWLKFRKGEISGYWGKPARADTARGFDRLNEKISTIIPKLKAVWSGSDSNHLFRSWYSIYPPNKSLFKAWILVFSLIFLMAVWIVVTLQTFLQGAEF
jgi:creatinine amidohydrolase/Fe(II)-dependent formamide hydrolase-like protein